MKISKTISILLILVSNLSLFSQIDGDNIFEENQIITIELTFSGNDWWDTLVTNYETETYLEADLTITDITGTTTITEVGVRLKGNSSYSHPNNKKSFKIDFNKYVSGQNYDGLKKLNFNNGFKDPTLMREKIFYDFCQDVGVPAPRANFANVYFNGTLWGFYTVVEQIDDQFLDWRILDDDGNLFKAGDNFAGSNSEADLMYYGASQSSYEDRYELKSNESENDWTDLIEFIDFINNSSTTDFENELTNNIELQEYLRSVAIDNLFSNLDSYTLSARNYYVYHNLTTNKWEWIKWDGNECFGTYGMQSGVNNMTELPLNYVSSDRPLLENIFNSSTLYNQYLDELCYINNNYFDSTSLNAIINDFKNLIQSSVYADGNKMYSNSDFDNNIENNITVGGGGGGQTIYGLKSFIQEKSAFVSGEVDCSLSTEDYNLAKSAILYPNPAQNQIIISLDYQPKTISIYSILGEKILEQSSNQNETSVDVSNLSNGVYLVNIKSDNGVSITKKLIIKK